MVTQPASPLWWIGVCILGCSVGLTTGAFGVGGGAIMTPLLTALFGVPAEIAVGTGLCQMLGGAAAAQWRGLQARLGEPTLGVALALAAMPGAWVGSQALGHLSRSPHTTLGPYRAPAAEVVVPAAQLLLLVVVALWMLHDLRRPSLPLDRHVPAGPLARRRLGPLLRLHTCHHVVSLPAVLLVGWMVGVASGSLGIGGGIVLVPLLVSGVGMRMKVAGGTTVTLTLAAALVGTIAHAQLGHVDLRLALVLMATAAAGAQAGVRIAARSCGHTLRAAFVTVVGTTTVVVAASILRRMALV